MALYSPNQSTQNQRSRVSQGLGELAVIFVGALSIFLAAHFLAPLGRLTSLVQHDDKQLTFELVIILIFLVLALAFFSFRRYGDLAKEVSKRRKLEEALLQRDVKPETIFHAFPDLFFRLDPDGTILDHHGGQSSTLSIRPEEFLGKRIQDVLPQDVTRQFHDAITQVHKTCMLVSIECSLAMPDGRQSFEARLLPLHRKQIMVIFRDITARKHMEEELRSLSLGDELTGLYNRRGFFTLAQQQLKIAYRMRRGVLLIFIDLDGMKLINDTLGHREGDQALIETAAILKETFRDSDIVARIGGDEFAVLTLEGYDSSDAAMLSRLNQTVGKHNTEPDRRFNISLSVGTVHYDPEHPSSIDELLARADVSMYEQKRSKQRAQMELWSQ